MSTKIKNSKGITLLVLCISIVVMIILAGISIKLLLNKDNSILKEARNLRETSLNETENSATFRNDIYSQIIGEKIAEEDNNAFNVSLDIIENTDEGTLTARATPEPAPTEEITYSYTFYKKRIYEDDLSYVKISSNNTLNSIDNIEFNKSYNIKVVVRDKKGNIVTKIEEIKKILEIGTYVRYGVSYKDTYSAHDFTTEEGRGWRVLDPGIDNGNGTYSNVKLISTGIPAELYYHYSSISSAPWKGTDEQISNYTRDFYASSSATNYNMYAAAGLYYNFGKIVFNQGTSGGIQNTGHFTKVNNKTTGTLAEDEFVKGNATEVHNLTMYELNQARNKKAGTDLFALNQTDGASSYSSVNNSVRTANDAATGLFYLIGLDNYGYILTSVANYWLASPNSGYYPKNVWLVDKYGDFTSGNSGSRGVRPVVSLTSVSESDIVGN